VIEGLLHAKSLQSSNSCLFYASNPWRFTKWNNYLKCSFCVSCQAVAGVTVILHLADVMLVKCAIIYCYYVQYANCSAQWLYVPCLNCAVLLSAEDIKVHIALSCRNVQRQRNQLRCWRISYSKLYRVPVDILLCSEYFLYEVLCKIYYFSLHFTL